MLCSLTTKPLVVSQIAFHQQLDLLLLTGTTPKQIIHHAQETTCKEANAQSKVLLAKLQINSVSNLRIMSEIQKTWKIW